MDSKFTEEQEMLRKAVRDFLESECPTKKVRELEESKQGYSPELWKSMAGLGWLGIVFPEVYGGTDGDFLDLMVLLEEMGRSCLPSPFFSSIVLCGLTILDAGTEEQKQQFLPKIATGEMILALALTEPLVSYEPAEIVTSATLTNDRYLVNGTKLFVNDANIADYLLCVARTKDSPSPENGITLFLIDTKTEGVKITPLETIGADRQCEVTFENVVVPRNNVVGELDRGWKVVERLLERAAIAKCGEMLGGAQRVLEMTLDYVKDRVQYGRPIGSSEAVQHRCVDMNQDVSLSRNMIYLAAWKLSKGLPCSFEVSAAKAWTSEVYSRVTKMGCYLHGGIGFTRDHDAGLYYRRAKAAELAFGDADFHKELVARQLGI